MGKLSLDTLDFEDMINYLDLCWRSNQWRGISKPQALHDALFYPKAVWRELVGLYLKGRSLPDDHQSEIASVLEWAIGDRWDERINMTKMRIYS